ncbi:MAG TPA: Ig-like domain-containing protein [Candidatus Krumholzibacteria bacterium]|nr:Ig-like domain-containing protein [Candidatus Krumholzibacteria bacterium]
MSSRLYTATLLFAGIHTIVAPAFAQRIGVYLDPTGDLSSWCNTIPSFQIYVVFHGDPTQYGGGEYKQVRFAVSPPPCASVVADAWVLGLGNVDPSVLLSGVTVPLGSCRSDEAVVARIAVLALGPHTECCALRVVPDSGAPSGMIEFTRCDDEIVRLFEGTVAGNLGDPGQPCTPGTWTLPSNPYPPDGATGVALDTDVAAIVHWPPMVLGCPALYGEMIRVFFGTDPNPPEIGAELLATVAFNPGPLQSNTKYYWKIVYINTLGSGSQLPGEPAVWSFTTTETVATQSSTWGAVKAMYR